jgi:hypothetical protein
MADDLIPFDFHGDEILLMDVDGAPHIVLKPAVESIGLDYWPQVEKLRKRSWAALASRQVQVSDQRREMLTCSVRTFLMLLATIDENRVAKDVRAKLVAYQAEVADAIESYWTKGGVINPRASADQLAALRAQAEVLTALSGIVDPGWLESKARIVAARAMGEVTDLDQTTKPLTVSIYLNGKGLSRKVIKSVQGMFGQRLKKRYVEVEGDVPPVMDDIEGRHAIRVAQYQEKHRPLFDEIWTRYYEGAAS